ncbi:branched-chain amino acid ABC transporter permease [Kineosporia sp. A_224]|uniref:branched-chain amino acid ABC transporter permease n=1 Tax=Kineosporia sp. A_224 TaxID=1962180 RepID=UPI0018E91BA7|nr:branched-chain amino acid ABC transporter permease [Kineosporia sp. A_224]
MSQTAVEAAESRPSLAIGALLERGTGFLLLLAVAAFAVWHLVATPAAFFTTMVVGLNQGALYALIALGYTLVYGIIELINFSHGDLFMLASVLSGFLMVSTFGATAATTGAFLALVATLVLAMLFGAALNTTAERVAYRRLRRAPKLAPLITAVGLSFVYQWGGIKSNGSGQRNWDTILGSSGFTVLNVKVPWSMIVVTAVTIPLLLGLNWVIQKTRQGKAMRATAQDQDAARLMGIDVDRTISLTFALGGAMAGAAGLLYLQTFGTTRYDAGFQLGLIAFTAAVLGGIGNLNGAVLGGVLIGLVQALNDRFGLGVAYSQTVVFTILILLMVFKPEGILGKPTTEKV